MSSCLTLLKPAHHFSVKSAGPAPDYADSATWAALPGHRTAARQRPPGLPRPIPTPADTVADVFYVHPTTYFWRLGYWNAPMRLRRLRHYTDLTCLRNQASLFYDVGRLYAPRYRQATLYSFFAPKDPSAQPALDLAYADVKAAFRYYLAHYNHGRPFILASHSQGTTHAQRLLHELVDDNPQLRKQLIAAYLVGRKVKPDEYQHLPALRDSLQTGGIIGWNTATRGTDFAPYHGLLVTNPLTWTLDSAAAPASLNRGGVPLTFKRIDPHVTGAQIHRGLLWAAAQHPPGYRHLHIPGEKALSASYHIVDYNLFYLNVRQNARARVRVWLKANSK
ncbi:DUF3089 domain-containing protein [Hymenobacter cheonanensis]|uniref:DUF3089 domain-containing protein n=1 Tax=Hymenobacter sp. CA2-7 TaxID=3063993 RepID=UPI002712B318|nr:DUF3089 domain-containing protein [Hymenobacter sp. CA2-7]MDO7885140.1 DUF3089 domain-containing protein [Hymenobacter sp. CA2-7]